MRNVLLAWLAFAALAQAQSVYLVRGGRPEATLIVGQGASPF